MKNEFAKNCVGCKYSKTEMNVTAVGEDVYISDGYKTCVHPNNDNEFWIPYLHNCPWKVVDESKCWIECGCDPCPIFPCAKVVK